MMTERQCECDPLDHGIDCPLRYPEQHECDWEFVVPYYKGAEKVFIVCRHKDCKMVLTKDMAVAMLNEYEPLKMEIVELRKKVATSRYAYLENMLNELQERFNTHLDEGE
jgi:hypothetical protein